MQHKPSAILYPQETVDSIADAEYANGRFDQTAKTTPVFNAIINICDAIEAGVSAEASGILVKSISELAEAAYDEGSTYMANRHKDAQAAETDSGCTGCDHAEQCGVAPGDSVDEAAELPPPDAKEIAHAIKMQRDNMLYLYSGAKPEKVHALVIGLTYTEHAGSTGKLAVVRITFRNGDTASCEVAVSDKSPASMEEVSESGYYGALMNYIVLNADKLKAMIDNPVLH